MSIICIKGLKHYKISVFIPILSVVCTIELLASNNDFFGWRSNYFLYNYNLLISHLLYLILFYNILNIHKRLKKYYLVVAFFSFLFIILNYLFYQGTNKFNSYSFLFFSIFNIFFSCILLIQIAVDDNLELSIFLKPFFWISSSLLLFSLGSIIVLGLQEIEATRNIAINGLPIYRIIMPPLNMLLYLGYSYSFILCKINQNK